VADTHTEVGSGAQRPAVGVLEARQAARAATAAELAKVEQSKVSDAPAAGAASATTEAEPAAGADDVAKETASQDEAVDPAKVEAKTETESEIKPDPDTEKRLALVQKRAKLERDAIAKERADLEKVRSEVEQQKAAVAKFEQLKARAKYAPADVLAELGLGEDDYEAAAKDIYARSKAAAADPKAKDAAIRMQREREATDDRVALRKEMAELKSQLAEREQSAKYEQAWNGYLSDVTKAATAEASPLLKNAIEKNPARAAKTIRETAQQIYEETGEWPGAVDVVVAYDKARRAELAEYGIDIPVNGTKPKTPPAPAPTNGSARTLANDMAGATPVPRDVASEKERRAETIRMMETGKTTD
jgi:hypothetical protein